MPIPQPNKNENEKDFIARCMSDDVMKKDYKDNKQRLAICYSQIKKRKLSESFFNLFKKHKHD
jgi:hypothetical protein